MPYQILVRHHGDGNLAALFSRGRCQDFPSLPFVAGGGQGLPPGAALSFWEEAGGMMVRNDGSVVARLGESSLGPGATGRISLGGVVVLALFYLFYLLRLDSQTQDILHQLNRLLAR